MTALCGPSLRFLFRGDCMEFNFHIKIEVKTDWVTVCATVPSSLTVKRDSVVLKYETGHLVEIRRSDQRCFIKANGFFIKKSRSKSLILHARDLEIEIKSKYSYSIAVNYVV